MSVYHVHLGVGLCLVFLVNVIEVQSETERIVKLRKFEKLKEDEKVVQSNFQVSEPDAVDHRMINGELKSHATIDNEWMVSITILRKDSDEKEYSKFKELPKMGFCELMDTYYRRFFYETMKDYSNAPHPDNCPLAPMDFQIKDYPLNASMLKKFLLPGYYRLEGQVAKDDEIKLMYMAELYVE